MAEETLKDIDSSGSVSSINSLDSICSIEKEDTHILPFVFKVLILAKLEIALDTLEAAPLADKFVKETC